MRILIAGGRKTHNIVEAVKQKFSASGDEIIEVQFIEDIVNIFSTGEYFDKALITEQSITRDKEITDEFELRERVNEFATQMANRNSRYNYVFLASDENMARLIDEEIIDIIEDSAVILSAPPYKTTFFIELIVKEAGELPTEWRYIHEDLEANVEENVEVDRHIEELGDFNVDLKSGYKELNINDDFDSDWDDTEEDTDGWSGFSESPDEFMEEGSEITEERENENSLDFDYFGEDSFDNGFEDSNNSDTEDDWDIPEQQNNVNDTIENKETSFDDFMDDSEDSDNEELEISNKDFEDDEDSLSIEDMDSLTDSDSEEIEDNQDDKIEGFDDDYDEAEYSVSDDDYDKIDKEGYKEDFDSAVYDDSSDYTEETVEVEDEITENEDNTFDESEYEEDTEDEQFEEDVYEEPTDNTVDDTNIIDDEDYNDNPAGLDNEMKTDGGQQPEVEVKKKKGLFGGIKKEKPAKPAKEVKKSSKVGKVNIKKIQEGLKPFAMRGNSIVVTGCGGCGVSFTAYSIANVLNQLGYNVLLVDMDTENRTQTYITKSNFDSIGEDDAKLMSAINSTTSLSNHVSIAKEGLHLLTMGMATDTAPVKDLLHKEKLNRFVNVAKSNYNFVVYDMPIDDATNFLADITYTADNLLLVADASNWGLTKMMMKVCNISSDDMRDTFFNKAQLLFNRYRNLSTLFGKKVRQDTDIVKILDQRVEEIIGEDPGFYFSDMMLAGVINDDPDIEDGWFGNTSFSDITKGQEIYLKLLERVVLQKD